MRLKRFLCLLFVLTMLPVGSLAVADPGSGNTSVSYMSGSGNEFALGYHTGLALGIQVYATSRSF